MPVRGTVTPFSKFPPPRVSDKFYNQPDWHNLVDIHTVSARLLDYAAVIGPQGVGTLATT